MKYVSYENHLKAAAEGGLEGDRKALHYVPHDYQAYATEFILSHPVAAILLQMGLGKSVITLTAIRELLDKGEVRKVLVIAPPGESPGLLPSARPRKEGKRWRFHRRLR